MPTFKTTTLTERADRLPPYACLLVARTGHGLPLTLKQIAARAGIPLKRVALIGRMRTFATVTLDDADRFRAGCGINCENEWRHIQYLKRTLDQSRYVNGLAHLKKLGRKPRRARLQAFYHSAQH